jgi:hypothetical protein
LEIILHSRSPQTPVLVISPDGYVRLSIEQLSGLPIVHLASFHDPDFLDELASQAILCKAAGFCECRSDTTPAISFGWGWYVHGVSNSLLLAPDPVRSNVMLIDKYGYDMGNVATASLLGSWLELFNWQSWVDEVVHVDSVVEMSC